MAIRRCPYCKAIIDEGSEYCSNCGTQLLFPEDEFIEEEIPGEEIVEEEDEVEEKGEEEAEEAEEEGGYSPEEEIDEQQDVIEEESEEGIEHEVVADEKLKKAKMGEIDRSGKKEVLEEPEIEEEQQEEEESTVGDFGLPPGEGRDEYFVEEDKEASIKTEDLEKIIDPEEKEKAEIEKFLKSLREDRGKWGGEIPPTDELPPWAEEIKEKKPEETLGEGEERRSQDIIEPEEEHPAVEEPMGESPPLEEEPLPLEEEQEEDMPDEEELHPDEITSEEKTPEVELPLEDIKGDVPQDEDTSLPDTSMGFPEGVEQEKLPFDDKPAEMFVERRPSSIRFPNWVKSRAFDVLFIVAIWIVAVHIASRMMATNLFRLISVAVLPIFTFYIVLLAAYLFLFFLFLGQTLGDHLFPHEE